MKTFTTFSTHLYTDILFGKGVESQAGEMVKKHGGGKALLVYGGGSIKKSGLYDRITASLKAAGLSWVELGGVQPNPRRTHTDKGVKLALGESVDFVLAAGGGSSLDTGKAIALALANDGDYFDFYKGLRKAEKMAPLGAVTTIAAAGSETSNSSVILDDIEGLGKLGINFSCIRPPFALLNPELTETVSAYQTAAGAVDILSHTVMRYFMKGNPVSHLADEFAEGLMRNVVRWAGAALENPDDYEARAELLMSAATSHSDITGYGRSGPRGGEHPLEKALSSLYDTAHGAGLALVMPAWLQWVADHGQAEDVARIAQFGAGVFGVRADLGDIKGTADEGLRSFRRWISSLGMPLTLKGLGVPSGDLDKVVDKCLAMHGGKIVGWVDLDKTAVHEIFASVVG